MFDAHLKITKLLKVVLVSYLIKGDEQCQEAATASWELVTRTCSKLRGVHVSCSRKQ